jgi:ATP-dependent Clp protease adaptor protein ClpS
VFIYDDDLTPIEFVYDVLKTIFFKNEIEAQNIADKAQQNGNTVVGEYTLDTARSRVAKATEMARMMNYPLKLEIENNGND